MGASQTELQIMLQGDLKPALAVGDCIKSLVLRLVVHNLDIHYIYSHYG